MGKTRQTGDIVSDGLVSVDIDNDQFKVGTGVTIYGSSGIISATSLYVGGTQFSAGISDVVEDTTPQLGGDLDLNSNDITGTGNFNVTGVITATSYDGQVKLSLEESDTTNYLTFTNDSQGYQTLKSNTGLAFNASNGTLTAAYFSGNGSNITNVNAATLDSIDSTSFLRSDQLDNVTSGGIIFNDNIRLYLGTGAGNDAELFYNGTNSYFNVAGGDLYLTTRGGEYSGDDIIIESADDFEVRLNAGTNIGSGTTAIYATGGGSVKLNYNGSTKFETNTGGATITGTLVAGGLTYPSSDGTNGQVLTTNGQGTISFATVSSSGGISNVVEDTTPQLGGDLQSNGNDIILADTDLLKLGSGNFDFTATHDGTNTNFYNYVGDLYIGTRGGEWTGDDIIIESADDFEVRLNASTNPGSGTTAIYATGGGSVALTHNGSTKFETTSGGINVTGIITATTVDPISVTVKNSRYLYFGNSNEGSITYDSTNLEMATSSGDLNLKGSGSVALYEGANKKLETASGGIDVTGNIVVSGTVDGRDVATDGTKLDTIATNATAYSNSDVDSHLNQSNPTSGYVLSWNGSDYAWVAQGGGGISSVAEDTTPQLGGNLDLNSNDITGTGNFNVTGVITATNFYGIASTASNVTVTTNNDTSDYKVVFAAHTGSTTGNYGLLQDSTATFTYNPKTNTLTAVNFSGNGSNITNVNATTLDSIDSTSFLRSDALDYVTSGGIVFNDNVSLKIGSNSDLQLSHDGTDNHISSLDKDLNIELAPDGSNPKIYIRPTQTTQGITLGGGSGNPVELYHTNAKKFETTSAGVTVTGTLVAGGLTYPSSDGTNGQVLTTNGQGTLSFTTVSSGGISNVVEDTTPQLGGDLQTNSNDIKFADNDYARFGSGSLDSAIFHDGTNTNFFNYVGDLVIGTRGGEWTGDDVIIESADDFEVRLNTGTSSGSGTTAIYATGGGSVALTHNGSTKFETSSTGATLTGTLTATTVDPISITVKNSRYLYFGNSNEGSITYDSTNLEMVTSSGDLNLKGSGSVALYEGANKKLETASGGVDITGNIVVSGTVDGRDVATDGTKLDTIATNATAYSNSDVDSHLNQSNPTSGYVLSWNGSDYAWVAQSSGGISNVVEDTTPQLGGDLQSNGNDILLADNDYLRLGSATGGDFVVVHGTAGQVSYNQINVLNGNLAISDSSSNERVRLTNNGNWEIKDNAGTSRVTVTTSGATVTGALVAGGLTYPSSDGTNGQVLTTNGQGTLSFTTVSGGGGISNVVEDTTPQLGGDLATNGNDILFADTDQAKFGTGNDLIITHSGLHSLISHSGTGNLYITNTSDDQDVVIRTDNGSGSYTSYFLADGSTGESQIHHYGSQKLATKSTGIDVTGNIVVSGTVDGRDVATDGTKLDTIATNATAYSNSDVDSHLNQSNPTSGYVLSWNGQDYAWVAQSSGGISNVVEDTTPQLGGDLDLNSNDITGTGNINVTGNLDVSGISTLTNQAEVRSDDGSQGRIDFYCEVNNAHYTRLQAAAHSSYSGNATVTLPSSSGTLLLTDGSGANLTSLNASNLGSGTIPDARFPSTLPAVSGSSLTGLTGAAAATYGDGSNVAAITVDSNGRITGISEVAISGGGGASEAFKTITVSGQSDVVADSATDTLTLVAGSNMTITTNATNDTITFASSGSGGSSTLSGLTDVTISNPSNGQVLKYNGSAWVNDTDATGSGGGGSGIGVLKAMLFS